MRGVRRQLLAFVALSIAAGACRTQPPATTPAPTRLERIQQRGALGCGVEADIPGFAERDAQGRYRGMDIDVCRAIAAAILGTGAVTYIPAPSVDGFHASDDIDVVARRITWELKREGTFGILFGPVMFHDGQSFLVRKGTAARALAGRDLCVAGGTVLETNLNAYGAARGVDFVRIMVSHPHAYDEIAGMLADGSCVAYTGDVSDLGAIRSKLPQPAAFDILPEMFSKEPLAPLVRETDGAFFTIVRWAIYALIAAEELGVTSANVDEMRRSPDADVQRLLGVQGGNGASLGLSNDWAYNVIKTVGNYAEMFDRNVGASSAIKLERGLNRLVKDGGLLWAPPLR